MGKLKFKWKSENYKVKCTFASAQNLKNVIRYSMIIKNKDIKGKTLLILGFNPTGTGFDKKQELTRSTENIVNRLFNVEGNNPQYGKLIFVNLTPIRGKTANELAKYIKIAIDDDWKQLGDIYQQNLVQINKVLPDSYDVLLATGELKHGLALALYQKFLQQILVKCDDLKVCCNSEGNWIKSKFKRDGRQKTSAFARNPINLGYNFPIVSIDKNSITGCNDNFVKI